MSFADIELLDRDSGFIRIDFSGSEEVIGRMVSQIHGMGPVCIHHVDLPIAITVRPKGNLPPIG